MYFLIFQPEDILKLCSNLNALIKTHKHSPILANWPFKWLSCVVRTYLPAAFNCVFLSCHAFYSKSTLCSCLSAKELFARRRPDIWSLSDCNLIQTHNFLVRKRTLNHLAKLAKWFGCVVSTYLYGAFECVLSFDCPLQSLKL